MNIEAIVRELKSERNKLDEAIAALNGTKTTARVRMNGRERHMSTAARRRISEAMKKRWASGKMGKRKTKAS